MIKNYFYSKFGAVAFIIVVIAINITEQTFAWKYRSMVHDKKILDT
jgi:hypothetical protein